jgi:hypothetical protein
MASYGALEWPVFGEQTHAFSAPALPGQERKFNILENQLSEGLLYS